MKIKYKKYKKNNIIQFYDFAPQLFLTVFKKLKINPSSEEYTSIYNECFIAYLDALKDINFEHYTILIKELDERRQWMKENL